MPTFWRPGVFTTSVCEAILVASLVLIHWPHARRFFGRRRFWSIRCPRFTGALFDVLPHEASHYLRRRGVLFGA